jgi:hypothetical protein
MVFFPNLKHKNTRNIEVFCLFIKNKIIFNLTFQKQKGKASKENPKKLVQNSKTLQDLQKNKRSFDLTLSPPVYTNS